MKHIMLVPDGNRRYAKRSTISNSMAFSKAAVIASDISKFILIEKDVPELTLFGFSYANITKRQFKDIDPLLDAHVRFIEEILEDDELMESEVKIKIIGRTELLPKYCKDIISRVEKKTERFEKKKLNLLMAYSGTLDLEQAIQKTQREKKEFVFENILDNCLLKTPIDLFIRTADEMRISDGPFYLLRYSEMYFIKAYFPDIKRADINKAINSYKKRKRTFGM